jgi:hypothetical protein
VCALGSARYLEDPCNTGSSQHAALLVAVHKPGADDTVYLGAATMPHEVEAVSLLQAEPPHAND